MIHRMQERSARSCGKYDVESVVLIQIEKWIPKKYKGHHI